MKAGFRLGDFNDSLVIVNAVNFLIEIRAVSLEVLVESINIVHVSAEKGQPTKKILQIILPVKTAFGLFICRRTSPIKTPRLILPF